MVKKLRNGMFQVVNLCQKVPKNYRVAVNVAFGYLVNGISKRQLGLVAHHDLGVKTFHTIR